MTVVQKHLQQTRALYWLKFHSTFSADSKVVRKTGYSWHRSERKWTWIEIDFSRHILIAGLPVRLYIRVRFHHNPKKVAVKLRLLYADVGEMVTASAAARQNSLSASIRSSRAAAMQISRRSQSLTTTAASRAPVWKLFLKITTPTVAR